MGCQLSRNKNNNSNFNNDNNLTLANNKFKTELNLNNSYKIVILGDISVGKTSIIQYFHNINKNNKLPPPNPTIGFAYFEKKIQINKKIINLQIWDTSGEITVRNIMTLYFRDADAIILTFDISDKKSLSKLNNWFELLDDKVDTHKTGIFLVGNKSDISKFHNDEFLNKQILELVTKHNLKGFLKTSAITGENIERLFETIGNYLLESKSN